MKKLLLVAAVVGVGLLAWQAIAQQRDEQDLWAEVTDALD